MRSLDIALNVLGTLAFAAMLFTAGWLARAILEALNTPGAF